MRDETVGSGNISSFVQSLSLDHNKSPDYHKGAASHNHYVRCSFSRDIIIIILLIMVTLNVTQAALCVGL